MENQDKDPIDVEGSLDVCEACGSAKVDTISFTAGLKCDLFVDQCEDCGQIHHVTYYH